MIEYILQIGGQNMLQVVYSSGANRFIFPDSWGQYRPNMPKTVRVFYDRAVKLEMKRDFGGSLFYFVDENNKSLIDTIKRHNERG